MNNKRLLTSTEVTRKLNISLRQLYYWELKGIIKPRAVMMGSRQFKRYTPHDVETLQKIKEFLDEGYTLSRAIEKATAISSLSKT
ncbi:hypothetical protein DRQ12_01445 [candidate division KSB1 bacterium]|nr:MAG: hypothetical protein DRQ12_01445 [candidate division KSB1 bacterium]